MGFEELFGGKTGRRRAFEDWVDCTFSVFWFWDFKIGSFCMCSIGE